MTIVTIIYTLPSCSLIVLADLFMAFEEPELARLEDGRR